MNNENEIDSEYTEEIVCPYCGYEFSDSFECNVNEDEESIIECGECGKEFYVIKNISISYSSFKPKRGICTNCNKEDVILEDYHGTLGRFENVCKNCKKELERKLIKEYYKTLDLDKEIVKQPEADYTYLESSYDNIEKIVPLTLNNEVTEDIIKSIDE